MVSRQAYFRLAASRFVDASLISINLQLIRGTEQKLREHLYSALVASKKESELQQLLAEDQATSSKRSAPS